MTSGPFRRLSRVAFGPGGIAFICASGMLACGSTSSDHGTVQVRGTTPSRTTPAKPTRSKAAPITADTSGPCYLSPESASTVTGRPTAVDNVSKEPFTCEYQSADKQVLLEVGADPNESYDGDDPCGSSNLPAPDVVKPIAHGCLMEVYESAYPGGYIVSVAVTGRQPIVRVQYSGPSGQDMTPVEQRVNQAATAIGAALWGGS
jgi:hypothetical protein